MGIINTLFGGGDVVSTGMKLIDSIHVSATEEIEAKTKSKVDLIKAYAPFKVAQRWMALIFSLTFIVSYGLCVGLYLMGSSDHIVGVKEIIAAFKIDYIMLTITAFYFGGGAFEGVLGKIKDSK